ncbi:MAG: hypothetical protein IPM18_13755 [Phycisphaerales bacterium]|nr:hypothetical protein [Phycisphaerales bacterium]
MKMAIGIFLQGLAFALMIWAVRAESQPSQTTLARLPAGVATQAVEEGPGGGLRVVFRDAPDLDRAARDAGIFTADPPAEALNTVVHGGRIWYGGADRTTLRITGVLSDTDRDRLLRATVRPDFLAAIRDLALETRGQSASTPRVPLATVVLPEIPPGFELRFAGFLPSDVYFDEETRTLTTAIPLADRDYKMLLLAGADPEMRAALNQLYVVSAKFKVSALWLVWFYILCTLGELCLSPVGLSMVSKLAPVRFQTMLMGMWLLTSFFGNYVAGLAGEKWGSIDPGQYFLTIAIVLVIVSAACFLVARRLVAMMHGVR